MHAVNEVLYHLGIRLSRMQGIIRPPSDFMVAYKRNLANLTNNSRGFHVFKDLQYDAGVQPESYIDHECTFAAQHIGALNPQSILNIGSYRLFVLGLLAHFQVTTVDVRSSRPISSKESAITCDAKKLSLQAESFDVVLSLCTVEHFGLGRYGDEFDPDGDQKALREMIRVLRRGGVLIFSTNITRAQPSIGFNAHRIYSHAMLRELCEGLACVEERCYSVASQSWCSLEQVTTKRESWDIYCGCWKKP
jgi:SAM-dependent methyltransferase